MRNLKNLMLSLWRDESGQDLAEYALLLVLIAVIVVTAVTALQGAITDSFDGATTVLGGEE